MPKAIAKWEPDYPTLQHDWTPGDFISTQEPTCRRVLRTLDRLLADSPHHVSLDIADTGTAYVQIDKARGFASLTIRVADHPTRLSANPFCVVESNYEEPHIDLRRDAKKAEIIRALPDWVLEK